jgi:hypothetical protein
MKPSSDKLDESALGMLRRRREQADVLGGSSELFADEIDAAISSIATLQSRLDRATEALAWAECHDPWLVDQIRERAAKDGEV